MKRHLKIVIIPLVLTAMVLVGPATGEPARGMEVGETLEQRTLTTLDGVQIGVPADTGMTVLIFWSTWSPRSAPALAMWQEYAETYAETGARVITVNAEKQELAADDSDAIAAYIEEHGVTLPVHQDEGLVLFNEIGVVVLPTTLFLKPDGTIALKYGSFPTSAREDLKAELEKELGIAAAEEEVDPNRGKLAYQPRNNALLYYNLGKRLHEKGFVDKAGPKYVEALQKDPEYIDPLRGLESLFFADGRTGEAEEALKAFLTEHGLADQVARISEPGESAADAAVAGTAIPAAVKPAPVTSPVDRPLTPMERMKRMMENRGK